MITESTINKVLEDLNSDQDFQERLTALVQSQPAIVSYLESEGFEILSNDERDLLWYLTVVIYHSVLCSINDITRIKVKHIEAAEEKNYDTLESDHLKFSEMADILFNNYEEEDLLAFVEDTVIPDEEDFPSPVGRKVIFITMKTIIDVLTEAS